MTTLWQHVERACAPSWRRLALGCTLFLLILLIDRWMSGGHHMLLALGVADETANLSTMLIFLLTLPNLRNAGFVLGCVAGSVAIDVDHIPLYLGSDVLTADTNRPLTHSLLTIGIVLILALATSGRVRAFCVGLAVGLGAHFWRDMATSTAGVPLLWPVDATGFTLPYPLYAVATLVALLVPFATSLVAQEKQRGPGQ